MLPKYSRVGNVKAVELQDPLSENDLDSLAPGYSLCQQE